MTTAVVCAAASFVTSADAQTVLSTKQLKGDPLPLGDLDGDGVSELLVTEPGSGSPIHEAGKVTLLSGADLSSIYSRSGSVVFEQLGSRSSRAGDVDGDAVPDYFVGDFLENDDGSQGNTRLLSGATHTPVMTIPCEREVRGIGDADLDGVPDFVIETHSGLQLRSGATGEVLLFDAEAGLVRVYEVGDVDGDGAADYATGPDSFQESHVRVVSGATGVTHLFLEGSSETTVIRDVAVAGDVDGDGHADIVVGDGERARCYSGMAGEVLAEWKPPAGAKTHSSYGWRVVGDVDLDGDGASDFVVSASRHDQGFSGGEAFGGKTGRVFAYSGTAGQRRFDVWGALKGHEYGSDLRQMGDRNGDGVPELVVRHKTGFDIVSGDGVDASVGTTALAFIHTDDFDEMFFHGLKGTKLKVRAWVLSGNVIPRVTFRRADDSVVKALDFDYAKDGTPSQETAKLKVHGLHRMRVLNLPKYDYQAGQVRVEVDVVHPKTALPRTAVRKGKPGDTLVAKVAALPGATLNAILELKKGYESPPPLAVTAPDGSPIDAAPFVTVEPGFVHLNGLPVTDVGVHRLEVPAGPIGKSKVVFHLDPVQPAPGPPLEIQ